MDSGATTKTYTVTVTRIAANDATLTALSLGDDVRVVRQTSSHEPR